MITVYGIPNCDTVKRARAWLADHGVAHAFHDFRKQGLPAPRAAAWLAACGADEIVNRRGTTWRGLDEATRASLGEPATPAATLAALAAHPSVIRRPVVEWADGSVTVGFDAAAWARRVGA